MNTCLDNTIIVQPVQWSRFQDIDDVEPLNSSDFSCLAEIREVLKKHDRQDRFGVALLHSHFDLLEDEVMLETSDVSERSLNLSPVKRTETDNNGDVGTIWKLVDGSLEDMSWCRSYCRKDIIFGHGSSHKKS